MTSACLGERWSGLKGVPSRSRRRRPETDQRVIGAGLRSMIEVVEADSPVLLATDDAQWCNPSSAAVRRDAAKIDKRALIV
jgi:hypothetical protein